MDFSGFDLTPNFPEPQPICKNFILEDLVHKDYLHTLKKQKLISVKHQVLVKSTQTEGTESIEYLLGKLILKHCPQNEIIESYVKHNVKHINTSSKLLQLLTTDTLQAQLFQNAQSRSNEIHHCTTSPHEEDQCSPESQESQEPL